MDWCKSMRQRLFVILLIDRLVGYSATAELYWREVYNTDASSCREECPFRDIRRDGQGGTQFPSLGIHIQ